MSGMGSNGTQGVQVVKAVGGVCIAQEPDTAKFPSMPRHVMDVGMADFVLRPAEMPDVLMRYAQHPYAKSGHEHAKSLLARERQHFAEVLSILRARTRHDFNGYKQPTLVRRIQRRMGINQLTSLADYVKLIRQNTGEAATLSDDLMINVTGFFRDPDAWETLRRRVIEPLVADRQPNAEIRCWVAACSSGEEAYTLGMLLVEAAEAANKKLDVKIFATDTAERMLSHARSGLYPGGIEAEINPRRLDRFFDKADAMYRVKKELREMVVFASQNVLRDPPFSRLDIACCRNLLIYLEPETQKRVLLLLHFGLREGGTLFLGSSETVLASEDLFSAIDNKRRIYRRVGPTRHGTVDFPAPGARPQLIWDDPEARSRISPATVTNRMLLEHYTPAAVTVDAEQRIVFYHGNTEKYLTQPRGHPTYDLLSVVRENIRGAVRTALQKAVAGNAPHTAFDGLSDSSGQPRSRIAVTAAPLGPLAPRYFLVTFEERTEPVPLTTLSKKQLVSESKQMSNELLRVRDELQSTIEELQSSNEELKASNEEVTSVNEELQSTNEELETSKEELQSLNEELATVNTQLQAKMDELEHTTNDLQSLLASTDIGVLFLDTQFRIRRFTPATTDLLDMIPTDVGRPLSDLAAKFVDPDLIDDARQVLDKLTPLTRELTSKSGRWYVRRVLPYRTTDNRIDGVVITFIDITDRKRIEEDLRQAKERLEAGARMKDQFLATLSHELRTPLSAILLWAKMLRRKNPEPAQIEEGLKAIEKSAESQKSLIDDLLDTSRITAGKLRLELRAVNIEQIVRNAIEATTAAAQVKGVIIEDEFSDNLEPMLADPERLEQIIWNLLSNAVKFTPAGGTITLRLDRVEQDVRIRVSDTGQGIKPEFLPQLFALFRQEDASATRRHGGLGLGLAITRQLVELHGGTITADSAGPGKGSVFTVRLPIRPASGAEIDQPPFTRGKTRLDSLGRPGLRILLVEDEADTREVLTKLYEQAGATVTAVSSAAQAIESYKRSRPDLVVSDVGLPGTDGKSMLRQIRALEDANGSRTVPAVALTAFAREEDRSAAIAAGFTHYLSKPVDPDQLLLTSRAALERHFR